MILSLKKYVIAAILALATSAAYAACVTNTIVGPGGRITMCTTCCMGQNCTTTCI